MIRFARKLGAVLMALAMMLVMAITVSAESFSLPRKADVDGDVIGSITEDGFTATFNLVADAPQSVNFYIKGDALDPEFWNQSDAYVEVDLTLNTDTSTVYAVLPGFTAAWGWVNPTVWDKYLKYGQTVTFSEPLSTYYDSFKEGTPLLIRVQLCSVSSTAETVEVQVSNIRVVGGSTGESTTVATTTTEATTTTAAPVETEPEVIETEAAPAVTEEASVATEEAVATEQAPAETTTTAATTTVKAEEQTTTAATTTAAAVPATTATYTSTVADGSAQLIKTLTIVVIVAAVLVVGAIVGYIIYKSKSKN